MGNKVKFMNSLECPDVGGDSGEAVDAVDHAELLDGLGARLHHDGD